MSIRTKRTYNLPEGTVRRVRELAAGGLVGSSQDAVVEAAVERLYEQVRAEKEATAWASAAADPEFRAEMTGVARDLDDPDAWPA